MRYAYLAQPTPPPQQVFRHGRRFGIVAAALMAAVSLVHLFRIDTLVPLVEDVLPFAPVVSAAVVSVIVIAEVFAIPVLLQMHLSPLARIVSGLFVAGAPLAWLLIAIWAYGSGAPTGQLGQFYELPSTALLILANTLWVGFNVATLWALGFGKVALRSDRRPNRRGAG